MAMISVIIVPIMTLVLFSAGLMQLSVAYTALNEAASVTGSAVSVCTSKEDADTMANRVLASSNTVPYLTDLQTNISIVDTGNFGAGFDWGMGQIAKVTVSGYVSTITPGLLNGRYERSTLVPIEGGGAYLGIWRLTAYCPCAACNGSWVGQPTASGRGYTPNKTIAMAKTTKDAYGFEWGDRFLIRGHIYTLEDGGDSNMAANNGGRCIDIFVATHPECYNDAYNGMAEVFYLGHGG